ncbi:MAG: efflux RND transporter periplasmic adaptor subunit [Gemmatimonadaceae bacterium]|nr:efflux RND transporter periplasmic adaptor subunit [Gemmatimonadaceae bacterium]
MIDNRESSRRMRRRWLIAGGVVIAAAAGWLLLRSQSDRPRKTSGGAVAAVRESSAMSGMAGMSMNSDGTVRLTASQIRQFGVTFDTVKLRTLDTQVRAPVVVSVDETRIVQITPKFGGFIERLFVNSTGQQVSRGQAVASIFSPELVAAQEEMLLAARLNRSMGQSSVPGMAAGPDLLSAARQRLRLWGISDAEINSILRSARVRRSLTLFSPASGVVTERMAVQGQSVMPGSPLMTIADLSTVWIIAELRESDARSATRGAAATIEMNAYPGERIAARIAYVYPTLQEESRTVRARMTATNPGGRLKPGMFGTALLTSVGASALTVPATAVIETGEKSVVFVDMGAGSLMPHDVRIGRRGAGLVEVLSGLDAGQIVVTSAQFLLESESNIGEVMRSMIGQGSGAMSGMEGMTEDSGAPAMDEKGADMKGMQMPAAPRR